MFKVIIKTVGGCALVAVCIYVTLCFCESNRVDEAIARTKLLAFSLDKLSVKHPYSTTVYFTVRSHLLELEKSENRFMFGWVYDHKLSQSEYLEDRLKTLRNWKKEFDEEWHNGEDR